MKHLASPAFWLSYKKLPKQIQALADRSFDLLKKNSDHPSLHFKRIRKHWSVRVGLKHRALGIETEEVIIWFWIGTHAEYDKKVK